MGVVVAFLIFIIYGMILGGIAIYVGSKLKFTGILKKFLKVLKSYFKI